MEWVDSRQSFQASDIFKGSFMNLKGCPNKHGNCLTNSKSSLLRVSFVSRNFNDQNKTRQLESILCER